MRALGARRLFALHFAALAASIVGFHAAQLRAQDAVPAAEEEQAPEVDEQRVPFESPLTPQERRWLMDQSERQRSELIPMQREKRIEAELGAPSDGPERMAPELRRIQRALGGSVVDQFDTLQPDPRQPEARRPSGERDERERRTRTEALRESAWQLDTAANRLENLDLYRQADRLREQAQRLRLDARDMIDGSRPGGLGVN